MRSILSLEMKMFPRTRIIITVLMLILIVLPACNLPSRQASQTQPATVQSIVTAVPTPTPTSLCDNQFFPASIGNTWQYAGNNSAIGAYERTDSISNLGSESFTVQSTEAGTTFTSN